MSSRLFVMMSIVPVLLSACGGSDTGTAADDARAVPARQSATARALRLPRMQPAVSRAITASDRAVVIRVRIVMSGTPPADTTVQGRAFDPACGETFVDTAVVRNGNAVNDAVVWVEGPTPVLITDGRSERRPTVQLDLCRLGPRMQIAAPGSTLMLVMRDSLSESLAIVPSAPLQPVDTVPFITYGQLVPVQHRADSVGMLAVFATRLPWARAFVAITPVATSALSDADGRVQFSLDARGTTATIRAWHPSLGIVSEQVKLSPRRTDYDVTLTFKR